MRVIVAFLFVIVAIGCADSAAGKKGAGTSADKAGVKSDKFKQAAIDFIKSHADDPSGLEILGWGKSNEDAGDVGEYWIQFRCKKIGNARDGTGPVSTDKAFVFYLTDDKDKPKPQVTLMQCSKLKDWAP